LVYVILVLALALCSWFWCSTSYVSFYATKYACS